MADEEDSTLQQRLITAREAFEGGDVNASVDYHNQLVGNEPHNSGGGYLRPAIFGGLDGVLTSFAIVAGSAGGGLSPQVILILGFSNIFADALSMGVGEFLSSKATNEWILSERKREMWEMENYPEGEVAEMISIFQEKGMNEEDATLVVKTMAKYKDFFVDIMMSHELELNVPEEDHLTESFHEGVIMFCSFAFFGAMPLLGYVIVPLLFSDLGKEVLFITACSVTGVVLFLLGSLKSLFCSQMWFTSGLETLILGGSCATVAYTIGLLLQSLVDEE